MDAPLLTRIAEALERLAPLPAPPPSLHTADAYVWHPHPPALAPVPHVAHVDLALLLGLDRQKTILLDNTTRFAAGLPANNAMLWGARGTGKSSLVKAVHAACPARSLALIEIARDDIATLPALLDILRAQSRRCLLFCDDLSFDAEDRDYKALKSVLEGGIAGRPANVLFYATSNRRHLMPRAMSDNTAEPIHGGEATDEAVSLSDRFGLWLGFYSCDQPTYLAIIDAYAAANDLPIAAAALHAEALTWSITRGARSGRVAAQFIDDLSARLGMPR